jgi:hypothetical protein
MSKGFKKPDLNAPRYRPKTVVLLSPDLYKKFIEKYPEHKERTYAEFKRNISTFNEELWKTAIEYRDGVDLPEGLGNIFIGTCWKKKKINIDFAKSNMYNMTITNHNHHTDGKLAKIFYTNYNNKYRFANRIMWMFKGSRDFKRSVAKAYPENWKKYIDVDPNLKINKLYRKQLKRDAAKKVNEKFIDMYNEFDMD